MIKHLRKKYARPRNELEIHGEFPDEAGVLIPITDHPESPDIVLTLRASHLNSHSGEVSFPGGKWEPGDQSIIHTALRETEEEIGLSPDSVEVVGCEDQILSRFGLTVTPVVGIVPHDVQLVPSPDELDAVFRVPLQFFLDDCRTQTDVYSRNGEDWWCPVYHFEGFKIWGLTARILVDFMNSGWQAGLGRNSKAPEVERKPLRSRKRQVSE